jgi:hypothetical protein
MMKAASGWPTLGPVPQDVQSDQQAGYYWASALEVTPPSMPR